MKRWLALGFVVAAMVAVVLLIGLADGTREAQALPPPATPKADLCYWWHHGFPGATGSPYCEEAEWHLHFSGNDGTAYLGACLSPENDGDQTGGDLCSWLLFADTEGTYTQYITDESSTNASGHLTANYLKSGDWDLWNEGRVFSNIVYDVGSAATSWWVPDLTGSEEWEHYTGDVPRPCDLTWGGTYNVLDNDAMYTTVQAIDWKFLHNKFASGEDYAVVYLEYDPKDGVWEWCDDTSSLGKYHEGWNSGNIGEKDKHYELSHHVQNTAGQWTVRLCMRKGTLHSGAVICTAGPYTITY